MHSFDPHIRVNPYSSFKNVIYLSVSYMGLEKLISEIPRFAYQTLHMAESCNK